MTTQAKCGFLGENHSARSTVGIIETYHVASILIPCNTSHPQYISCPPSQTSIHSPMPVFPDGLVDPAVEPTGVVGIGIVIVIVIAVILVIVAIGCMGDNLLA